MIVYSKRWAQAWWNPAPISSTIIASPFSNLLWTPEMFKILQFLVEFCPQRPKLRSWGFSVAGNILYDFNLPSSFLSVLQRSKVLTMSIVIVQILRPGRVRRNNSSSGRRNLNATPAISPVTPYMLRKMIQPPVRRYGSEYAGAYFVQWRAAWREIFGGTTRQS